MSDAACKAIAQLLETLDILKKNPNENSNGYDQVRLQAAGIGGWIEFQAE
jgi:hypothetical protein